MHTILCKSLKNHTLFSKPTTIAQLETGSLEMEQLENTVNFVFFSRFLANSQKWISILYLHNYFNLHVRLYFRRRRRGRGCRRRRHPHLEIFLGS